MSLKSRETRQSCTAVERLQPFLCPAESHIRHKREVVECKYSSSKDRPSVQGSLKAMLVNIPLIIEHIQ